MKHPRKRNRRSEPLLKITAEDGPSVVFVPRTRGASRRFKRRFRKGQPGRLVIDKVRFPEQDDSSSTEQR